MKKFLLSLASMMLLIPSANADVLYELTFDYQKNQTKIANYTDSWTVKCDNNTWTMVAFNNNNNGGGEKNEGSAKQPQTPWDFVRCGRKNNASVATITTNFASEGTVNEIVLSGKLNAANSGTTNLMNSAKVEVYDIDPTTATDPKTVQSIEIPAEEFKGAKGKELNINVSLPDAVEGKYYRIVFDIASGTANGFLQIGKVNYNGEKPITKKDFDLTMILKGSEENEDIKTALGEFDDEFHYYMPEGDELYEFEFNLAEGLTCDMFKDMATWKMTNESTSEDVTNSMLDTEGTYAVMTPYEAGTYRIYFDLKENEHYTTAGSNNYYVHVYPHVDHHFAYDDLEINSCADKNGVFKLSKFETTNDGNYTYYYKVVNSGAATLSVEEEGYTKYNHETGINLGAGTHTIEFIAEKNGVKSLKPKTFTISVATGVEAVGAEAGEAVYFDLQGRRVNGQPEQGLYIVRKGGKTSKVIL